MSHATQTQTDGLHSPFFAIYATKAAREAVLDGDLNPDRVGCQAYQEDDGSIHVLTGVDPISWVRVTPNVWSATFVDTSPGTGVGSCTTTVYLNGDTAPDGSLLRAALVFENTNDASYPDIDKQMFANIFAHIQVDMPFSYGMLENGDGTFLSDWENSYVPFDVQLLVIFPDGSVARSQTFSLTL